MEKASGTRQVRARKTNASEPLRTCRKAVRRHRNQACEVSLGGSSEEACRRSEWWPAYRRREPSAGVRAERGNLPPRCKGRNSSGGPTRVSVPRRGGGTDRLAVARKPGNAGGAKGPAFPGVRDRSTRVGRSRCLTPSLKRFRRRPRAARHWLRRLASRDAQLFALWPLGVKP